MTRGYCKLALSLTLVGLASTSLAAQEISDTELNAAYNICHRKLTSPTGEKPAADVVKSCEAIHAEMARRQAKKITEEEAVISDTAKKLGK